MTQRRKPTVLLTGFDAFGGETINPSWMVAEGLHDRIIGGYRIVGVRLPTSFSRAPGVLRAAMREHSPKLIVCIGQAGGRERISLERVAINLIDARIPDNDGAQPIDTPILRRGPAAYFSTLPIKSILRDLQAANIPTEISQTAGTFVCNHLFYTLMRALATKPSRGARPRGGFVHIPYLPEQAAQYSETPSLPLHTMKSGIEILIATAIATKRDVRIAAGATH